MTAQNDPPITLHALSSEVGIAITALRRWAREGHIPRHAKGTTTLIAALRGILRAVEAEASDDTPYEVKAAVLPAGAVLLADVNPALDRIAAAFDAAAAEAVAATEKAISELHLPPRASGAAARARQAEKVRTDLIAARRRMAAYPAATRALVKQWTPKE